MAQMQNAKKPLQEQIMTISNAEAMSRASNINMRNKLGQCRS